jgi:hypothetical protein
MNQIVDLHRKIRHYCLDNFDFWMKEYQSVLNGRPNTFAKTYEKGDHNLYPRYQALEALLQGVEEVNPETTNTIEELKIKTLEIALSTETIFTKDNHGTAKNAIEDERKKFIDFVNSVNIEDLESVPELFYRRKLTKEESQEWTNKLKLLHKIDFSGFWFPKEDIQTQIDQFLVFDEDEIREESESKLNRMLKSEIDEKYYIFNEDGTNYELEKETFDIFSLSPEAYLIDKNLNWLIYYSHEDFYIFKSESIKNKVVTEFPELIEYMNKLLKNGS